MVRGNENDWGERGADIACSVIEFGYRVSELLLAALMGGPPVDFHWE